MKEKSITITLPKPTQEGLKKISKKNGTSKKWEARKLVIEGVESHPDTK